MAGETEKESTSLEANEKGENERMRTASQDKILMQEQREIERNAGTIQDDKTLQFAQVLTDELFKDQGGSFKALG